MGQSVPRPPSADRTPFGAAYREIIVSGCKRRGITQTDLAEEVGVTVNAVTIPMRRERAISMRKLEEILRALDTPKEERESCLILWIEERLVAGAYGKAVRTLLTLLRNSIGRERYREALMQAVESMRDNS